MVIFLLVFSIVEGIFRFVGIPYKVTYIPAENSFAQFDSELGWSYIPGKSTIQKTVNTEKQVYFDINGIRVPHSDYQLDNTLPSILFIGGSFTMGHGLSYEESFVGKFASLKGIPYQAINLGVQGYGSDQALIALKKYLPTFNTKVVVYTFIEDHILRNGNYDRRMLIPTARFLGTKPHFKLNRNKELFLNSKPLLYEDYIHSYQFDFLKMRIGAILGNFPPFPSELTKAIIQEMKRYSNEHDAHFVVINWRWTRNDYDELFNDLDVDVIDTMEETPADWGKMVLHGGTHPDAEAGDHVASLLLKYFREKGLLQYKAER
jgi:hypothetical protein